jgi:NADPH-dependent curcumin reductase CurA
VVDAQAGTVEYLVGATPAALAPRIRARVAPGPALGYDAGTSVVTLEAWRTRDMSDERWMRLVHTHEAEIELIRAQLESA